MSLLSGGIKEGEQAAEQLVDHVAQTVGQQVAGLLPALEGYDLVIRIRLEKRAG